MRIIVKAPLMGDKIKELLDGTTIDGATFSFIDKKGREMTFGVEISSAGAGNQDQIDAAMIAKSAIKSTDYGKGIYFSVVNA